MVSMIDWQYDSFRLYFFASVSIFQSLIDDTCTTETTILKDQLTVVVLFLTALSSPFSGEQLQLTACQLHRKSQSPVVPYAPKMSEYLASNKNTPAKASKSIHLI